MTLDVGCGSKKVTPDAVGIDVMPGSAAETIWNLNTYPWPLPSDHFDRVHMSHIIEHLEDPVRAMAEVHRVAQADAQVYVVTPHFSSHNSYVDPTHRTHLAAGSFQYFTGRPFATFGGSTFTFDIVDLALTFGGNLILDNAGRAIAHLSLAWYERHAAWVFPALDIQCHLRARK